MNNLPASSETKTLIGQRASNIDLQQLQIAITQINNNIQLISNRVDSLANIVSGYTPPTPVNPEPPTNVSATPSYWSITLRWSKATNSDSVGIEVSTNPLTEIWTNLAFRTDTFYVHSGLNNGVTNYYRLRTYYQGRYSVASAIVSATTLDTVITGEPETGWWVADAEEGDLNEFTSLTISNANLNLINEPGGIHGLRGFRTIANNNTATGIGAYGTYTLPVAKDSLYLRAYLEIPDTLKFTTTGSVNALLLGLYSGSTRLAAFGVKTSGSADTVIQGYVLTLHEQLPTAPSLTTYPLNQNLLVEIFYKKGSGTDGVGRIYMNGNLVASISNGTYTGQVTSIRAGFFSLFSSTIKDGSVVFDDVKIDTNYIGTYSGSQGFRDSFRS